MHSFHLRESLDSAIVSFRSVPQARDSPQPLRPALKKTSLIKSSNKVEEKFKDTEKGCEENRISVPKRATETQAKTEKSQPTPARLLQKKKTVAFGRTVNVSQTIEVKVLDFQFLQIFILNFTPH